MVQNITALIRGTGAAQTICLGFKPDWVRLKNLSSATKAGINWNRFMLAVPATAGGLLTKLVVDSGATGNATEAVLAISAGVITYTGGTVLTADDSAIKVWDPNPEKRDAGTLGTVNLWTLETAANKTGKFNAGVLTSAVGPGSKVAIMSPHGVERWYTITAMTNDGDAANEVTLDAAAPTGEVTAIRGNAALVGAKAGDKLDDGIRILETAAVNISAELIVLEAGTWE